MSKTLFRWSLGVCLVLGWGINHGNAADRFWIGGDNDWVDDSGNLNWSPVFDEPDDTDVAIFNTDNNVDLGSNNLVKGLTLFNGINLSTDAFTLSVIESVSLTGAGTRLTVGGNGIAGLAGDGLVASPISVGNGSTLSLGGNRVGMVGSGTSTGLMSIGVGGTLFGNGQIENLDSDTNTFRMLRNNGTLSVGSVGGFNSIGNPTARTLHLSAPFNLNTRVDLDGFNFTPTGILEPGVVNVPRNQTLDIDVQLNDDFNGTLNMNQQSRLEMRFSWSLAVGGLISIDNGFIPGSTFPSIPAVPAGNATIAGGLLTHSGGTIEVADGDGTLTFEDEYTADGGTLDNSAGGTVVFQETTVINNGHSYLQGGTSLTVIDGAVTTINDDNINLDGSGGADWRVTNEGRLNIRAAQLDTSGNSFSGELQFDGGIVDVNVDGSQWRVNGGLVSTGGGRLIGDRVEVGNDVGAANADIDVDGGTLRIDAPVTFRSDSRVNVAVGATLTVNNADTIFAPINGLNSGSFSGTGTFNVRGAQFDEDTTLDFSGGTVSLDGPLGTNSDLFIIGNTAADTDVNAILTVNAATFDDFGYTSLSVPPDSPTRSDLNFSDAGTLTVNLDDPSGAWNVLSNGILNYNGVGAVNTFLAGSDINMDGTLNVVGAGRSNAGLIISGTVTLQTTGGGLQLGNGGEIHAGATVLGDGTLLNMEGEELNLADTANVDVQLDNEGFVDIAGLGVGQVNVQSYRQSSLGAIKFDLGSGSSAEGDIDQLFVANAAELAGEVRLVTGPSLIEAYDTFTLIDTGTGVSGIFETVFGVSGGNLPAMQGLAVTYAANTVDVTRALLGDANLDGSVDVLSDAAALINNLGTISGGTWATGDFNGDGAVDVLADASALINNLGVSSPSSSVATRAVPEPSGLSVLGLTVLAILTRRCR